jgi:hypothetical protein
MKMRTTTNTAFFDKNLFIFKHSLIIFVTSELWYIQVEPTRLSALAPKSRMSALNSFVIFICPGLLFTSQRKSPQVSIVS